MNSEKVHNQLQSAKSPCGGFRGLGLFLFLFLSITASAQTILLDRPEIFIGTSQGITVSQLVFNPSVRQDWLFGYNGGIAFRYIAERNLGLQIELNYSQRGWKERDNLYARRLNYIELPFLAYISSGGERVSVFLTIGPKASWLLSEEVLFNNSDNTDMRHTDPIANRFDYGATLGGGIQFMAGRQIFSLELRANYSLSTTFSNDRLHSRYAFSNNINAALNLAWMMRVN